VNDWLDPTFVFLKRYKVKGMQRRMIARIERALKIRP
jgi:hypothetical protein